MEVRKFEIVGNKFRKHPDEYIQLPLRMTNRSAGYDFYLPCDVKIEPGERVMIMSDVKVDMHDDEVLMLHIRSSMGIKKGIVLSNGTGVVDKDYYGNEDNDGNIGLALWNTSFQTQRLQRGDRICQGIFVKYGVTDDDECQEVRVGGIGSTNK